MATDEEWTKYAQEKMEGRRITKVRYLTKKEAEVMGWYRRCVVFQLDDGTLIFPSRDDEGNDAGALFGQDNDGNDLTFPVI